MYICGKKIYRLLLLQVDNLNLATNLENYFFNAMLIACKCMPLYKNWIVMQKVNRLTLQPSNKVTLKWMEVRYNTVVSLYYIYKNILSKD